VAAAALQREVNDLLFDRGGLPGAGNVNWLVYEIHLCGGPMILSKMAPLAALFGGL
jgi:hypothetical protein